MRTLPTSTRGRHCISAVAIFTALSLGSAQALAQTPAGTPTPTPTVDHTRSPDAPLSVDAPEAPPATTAESAPPEIPATPDPPAPGFPVEAEPPMVGPEPAPSPSRPIPVAHDTTRGNQLRVAGIGTMAGGGVVSLLGFALTLAGTIQGRRRHDELAGAEDERQRQDCSRMTSTPCARLATQIDDLNDKLISSNRLTQVGGATMLTGFLVIAAGGIVYRLGIRKLQPPAMSRLKLSPSIGGLVLSGRF
ncbi:MAG: hypothetical protein H0T76_18360 [Nannocystis sp.]|nr:hypothetical protein [Nannocystis sp.]MBA3548450.1 hypothetical protein [Nannocystis sp.]